jgi:hypothetical protein
MKPARYRQHIIGKLGITETAIRDQLDDATSKTEMRQILQRHNLLTPKCQAETRQEYSYKERKMVFKKCGRGVTIWWDHELNVPVCRQCAAKLNASGTQRCTKVPSKKRKA